VPRGLPTYTLRTGSGRTDGRDVYSVIRCVALIVVFGVGTQLPRRSVMTRRPHARAGGGCYLFLSKLVCVKVGSPFPVNPYGESLRLTQPTIQVSDLVMLNAKNISAKRPLKNLSPKLYGPFTVLERKKRWHTSHKYRPGGRFVPCFMFLYWNPTGPATDQLMNTHHQIRETLREI